MRPVPKKKQIESPLEQGKRFMDEARRMIDAGELSPIEADKAFEEMTYRLFPALPKKRS